MSEEYDSKKKIEYQPASFEKHYYVLKDVEQQITDRLEELEHEELLIGLRVAYDFLDSGNEPNTYPYTIEFGYLGLIDNSIKCEEKDEKKVDRATWLKATRNQFPFDFLYGVYKKAKEELEKETKQKIRLDISMVLHGSSSGVRMTCSCGTASRPKFKTCSYNNASRRYDRNCCCDGGC